MRSMRMHMIQAKLTAEMLAAPGDDDDPFLTSDDDEDELDRNELTVEDMD